MISASLYESLVSLRHQLHQIPEVSSKESETAALLIDYLRSFEPTQLCSGLGGHGILALWTASNPGPTLLFRAELDALPINDLSGKLYQSKHEGKGHQCGHDGHMAMVAGLAPLLHRGLLKCGQVGLLFQPAEETGTGAAAMLADGIIQKLDPDHIFALHNLPGYPEHTLVWRSGPFTAAVISVDVILEGRETHAATPELGRNPAVAIADLIHQLKRLEVSDPKEKNFLLITPIQIQMGQAAYGISAGSGILSLTLRSWNNDHLERTRNSVQSMVVEIATEHQLQADLRWKEYFAATENHPNAAAILHTAASNLGLTINEMSEPNRFGEDFGRFTQSFPGAMAGLGAGIHEPPLHDPAYDFRDDLLSTGVALFQEIIRIELG